MLHLHRRSTVTTLQPSILKTDKFGKQGKNLGVIFTWYILGCDCDDLRESTSENCCGYLVLPPTWLLICPRNESLSQITAL